MCVNGLVLAKACPLSYEVFGFWWRCGLRWSLCRGCRGRPSSFGRSRIEAARWLSIEVYRLVCVLEFCCGLCVARDGRSYCVEQWSLLRRTGLLT